MHVEAHDSVEHLQSLARLQRDAMMRARLRAVALARDGYTAEEVADEVGHSRRRVQEWVRRYNRDGVCGLKDRPRPGRRCKLTAAQREELAARLDEGPRPEDGVCTLRGPQVRRIIEHEFNVMYNLSAIYPLLHRLGYSCLMPRSTHPKADPAAQEALKKRPWAR